MSFSSIHVYFYVLPLVLVISLVYSATRHESWRLIWTHAARLCLTILMILAVTMGALLVVHTWV